MARPPRPRVPRPAPADLHLREPRDGSALRIAVVGGGPAGLVAARTFKQLEPRHEVTVYEARAHGDAPGLGITLPAEARAMIELGDPAPALPVTAPWRTAELRVNGETFGVPFEELVGVSRAALVAYLERRCEAEGVVLRHGHAIAEVAALEAELVIGADGVTSAVRAAGEFGESSVLGDNRFAWLGSREALPAMRLTFDQTPHGMLLTAAYPYATDRSTVIVECSEACWRGLALAETLRDRFPLVDTEATWRQFRAVRTQRLVHGRLALVGDAGASMYYALGAGTMMAVQNAAMLAALVCRAPSLAAGLAAYDREARAQLDAVQQASEIDLRAMAQLDRLPPVDPPAFAHAYVKRFG